ncbi:hypothetical protein BDZ89DRAFT_1209743 [Hymenopellis radicata]|nr:hypothetical protein BDZ89DRAFT_1209743 [Hymenopellis radicata]
MDFPATLEIPTNVRTCTVPQVDAMMKTVNHIAKSWLQTAIDTSYKTYLLWNRLEPLPPPDKPAYRVIFVRHSLRLSVSKHRKALIRLLLSDPSVRAGTIAARR